MADKPEKLSPGKLSPGKLSPEVLSPAGGREAMRAAAAAGADAVYFGAGSFNARAGAENFDGDALQEAVAFCHINGMKAYLALNTLVFGHELAQAAELAQSACAAGVDAFIVQDMGLVSLLKRAAPKARLHASTQMSVHSPDGVMELARMGFSRVVLARELTRGEIAQIAAASPIELEVFVHGALCMSLSGQCLMSAFFSGAGGVRSANRGMCAQPCRLPFAVKGADCSNAGALSLKDNSLAQYVGELADMGVRSLKIEGRMKRPEYVAAATAVFRKAADGAAPDGDELERLRAVFSRDGFTDGYYTGNRGRDMFGTRRREDVIAAAGVLGDLKHMYESAAPRVAVDFDLTIKSPAARLCARDENGNTAVIDGCAPEKARVRAMDEATAAQKLSKTGGTPFYAGNIKVNIGDGLTIPVCEINRLRREALDEITRLRAEPNRIPFDNTAFSTFSQRTVENSAAPVAVRLRLRDLSQLPAEFDPKRAEIIFIPAPAAARDAEKVKALAAGGARIGIELPRAVFSSAARDGLADCVRQAAQAGATDILCGNLGSFALARESGLTIHGDFGLNAANSPAAAAYASLGARSIVLSPETPARTFGEFAGCGIRRGLIVYGRVPLMLTRNCPVKSFKGCSTGSRCCALTDRKDCEFPVVCQKCGNSTGNSEYSEILNSRPIWLADRKKAIEADFAVLYFTTESAEEAEAALRGWENGLGCDGPFTRGLYFVS